MLNLNTILINQYLNLIPSKLKKMHSISFVSSQIHNIPVFLFAPCSSFYILILLQMNFCQNENPIVKHTLPGTLANPMGF